MAPSAGGQAFVRGQLSALHVGLGLQAGPVWEGLDFLGVDVTPSGALGLHLDVSDAVRVGAELGIAIPISASEIAYADVPGSPYRSRGFGKAQLSVPIDFSVTDTLDLYVIPAGTLAGFRVESLYDTTLPFASVQVAGGASWRLGPVALFAEAGVAGPFPPAAYGLVGAVLEVGFRKLDVDDRDAGKACAPLDARAVPPPAPRTALVHE